MKLKKGDRVRVLSGKDRGKEGEIMRAFRADSVTQNSGTSRRAA